MTYTRLNPKHYLPLAGGTMTGTLTENGGSINIKAGTIDRDTATEPSALIWEDGRCLNLMDVDGETVGRVRIGRSAQGVDYLQLVVWNEDSGGASVYNTFGVTVGKDGAQSYSVGSPAAFRSAIGLGSLATKSSAALGVTVKDATASSTAARSANTNFTIDVTLDAVDGCIPMSALAVKLSAGPATVTLRGYDMDGLSFGGTPVVHTYWHTSAAIASGTTVTAFAQVAYLRQTAT